MSRKKALFSQCAAVMLLGLVASASVYAKNLGHSIKVPPSASVQMQKNGQFSIKGGSLGLSGTFSCNCLNGGGTCELSTVPAGGGTTLLCHKGTTGTCTGSCDMLTTTTGIQ